MTRPSLDKAVTALSSARLLMAAGDTDGATNRAYYAMFDAAAAALQWASGGHGPPVPKTHNGLIACFGHDLVTAGRIPAEYGRSPNRVQELRMMADYLSEPVPGGKAYWAIEEAEKFLSVIETLLRHARQSGR